MEWVIFLLQTSQTDTFLLCLDKSSKRSTIEMNFCVNNFILISNFADKKLIEMPIPSVKKDYKFSF